VLVAMVILAIGLMGLQALGISAARSVVLGQVQSAYAARASAEMERGIVMVEQDVSGTACPSGSTTLDPTPGGDKVVRTLEPGPARCRITIEITPDPDAVGAGAVRPQTYTLVHDVFVP
jgi:hypothetical protein